MAVNRRRGDRACFLWIAVAVQLRDPSAARRSGANGKGKAPSVLALFGKVRLSKKGDGLVLEGGRNAAAPFAVLQELNILPMAQNAVRGDHAVNGGGIGLYIKRAVRQIAGGKLGVVVLNLCRQRR